MVLVSFEHAFMPSFSMISSKCMPTPAQPHCLGYSEKVPILWWELAIVMIQLRSQLTRVSRSGEVATLVALFANHTMFLGMKVECILYWPLFFFTLNSCSMQHELSPLLSLLSERCVILFPLTFLSHFLASSLHCCGDHCTTHLRDVTWLQAPIFLMLWKQ